MLHTIKDYDKHFNLLHLDYGELLIDTIKCYNYSQTSKRM